MSVTRVASGMLNFIRYAFMPNHLGYCGGGDQDVLFEHAVDRRPEARLAPMLAKFSGAWPYLCTIAEANSIGNPFDERVVEAYWLGNELLDNVEAAALYKSLEDRFGDKLPPTVRDQVLRKPPQGARPYHLFHVIDVYRHLGSAEVGMAAMEDCRISWGRVVSVEGAELEVLRRPLVIGGSTIELAEERRERVLRSLEGRGFADDARPGDWVAIHWGWTCEVLDDRKLSNLHHYTNYHLRLANHTL